MVTGEPLISSKYPNSAGFTPGENFQQSPGKPSGNFSHSPPPLERSTVLALVRWVWAPSAFSKKQEEEAVEEEEEEDVLVNSAAFHSSGTHPLGVITGPTCSVGCAKGVARTRSLRVSRCVLYTRVLNLTNVKNTTLVRLLVSFFKMFLLMISWYLYVIKNQEKLTKGFLKCALWAQRWKRVYGLTQ